MKVKKFEKKKAWNKTLFSLENYVSYFPMKIYAVGTLQYKQERY